jgi:hypothetical protein
MTVFLSRWLLCVLTGLACACGRGVSSSKNTAQNTTPKKDTCSLRASVDKAVGTTADTLTYTVTLETPQGMSMQLPEPGASLGSLRITEYGKKPVQTIQGKTVEERWYRLRADLVGTYVLPALAATCTGPNATTQTLNTSSIFIDIQSVLPKDGSATDIRGLKPLVPQRFQWPWKWIACTVALAAAGIGFWVWKKRRSRSLAHVPSLPPHETALAALNALRGISFSDPQQARMYFFSVSEILRTYIEGRYGLNATDLTSEEILSNVSLRHDVPREQRHHLRDFFMHTDAVKFASADPTEQRIHTTYEQALSFVENTLPQPEPTPQERG